jgi:tetratricopeptide (TPR) repeat protein
VNEEPLPQNETEVRNVAATGRGTSAQKPVPIASVRVSSNGYVTAFVVALFIAAFSWFAGSMPTTVVFAAFAAVLPVLAVQDRITADGKTIRRSGIVPRAWAALRGLDTELALQEIEQVETQALRALRRGGQIYYRYRTTVVGRGRRFVFASGGRRYRAMVGNVLRFVPESCLDNRSIEVRDYLADPLDVLLRADLARIPGPEVLEETLFAETRRPPRAGLRPKPDGDAVSVEGAAHLRRLANELRVAGFLVQALEAFRRAAAADRADGWVLFEAARCLHSLGGANRDRRMQRRALALLRLAGRRAGDDRELLSRIGECHFQFGEWYRAKSAFQNAADTVEENFRALRGLAEIALREGKLAHVILHFRAAARIAETDALRRWTLGEAEYFSMLSGDEEYLRREIRRVNRLDEMMQAKRKAFRISFIGIPPMVFGIYFGDEMVAQIGWAVSGSGLLFWAALQVGLNVMGSRVRKGKV